MSDLQTVQQSPTDLQASQVLQATAAVNAAVVATIEAQPDKYIYIVGLDLSVSQDGTATANTNQQFTTDNLWGWAHKYSLAATANLTYDRSFVFNKPVRSQTKGLPVKITSPAAKANSAFSINVYYYYGD